MTRSERIVTWRWVQGGLRPSTHGQVTIRSDRVISAVDGTSGAIKSDAERRWARVSCPSRGSPLMATSYWNWLGTRAWRAKSAIKQGKVFSYLSPFLSPTLVGSLSSCCGIVSTPAIERLCNHIHPDRAIRITISHRQPHSPHWCGSAAQRRSAEAVHSARGEPWRPRLPHATLAHSACSRAIQVEAWWWLGRPLSSAIVVDRGYWVKKRRPKQGQWRSPPLRGGRGTADAAEVVTISGWTHASGKMVGDFLFARH